MYMPAPQERQPDIGIKEIQRVIDLLIRQVYRWSFGNNQREFDPLWPRPLCLQDHTSHTEKNQFPPPVPLISGKGAPECPPWSESILASQT
jgi:hypothetical protein